MRKTLALLTALILTPAFAQTAPATAPATPVTAAPVTTAPITMPAHSKRASTPAAMPMTNGAKINVNTASAADLTKIPGVSAKVAADIIKNRPYKNSAELVKKVKGIGPKNVLKMNPVISF